MKVKVEVITDDKSDPLNEFFLVRIYEIEGAGRRWEGKPMSRLTLYPQLNAAITSAVETMLADLGH